MIHTLFCDVLYEELTAFVITLHSRTMKKVIFNKGTYVFTALVTTELILFFNKLYTTPENWMT